MSGAIEIMFPAPPAVFAVFLGIVAAYFGYHLIKFVVSLWTGA